MRAVWLTVALSACGDNAHAPKLDAVASLPNVAAIDLAFDRDNAPVVALADGTVKRRKGDAWRGVALGAEATSGFGSDLDGAPLVAAGPSVLRIDGGMAVAVGGEVPAGDLDVPMAAPSMNRYVRARDGRTFVLAHGGSAWVESPPMFVSRPVRTYRGSLYEPVAAGVQQYGRDGTRSLAITCEELGRASCAELIVAGERADGRVIVADERGLATVVGEFGEAVERVDVPGMPLRAAAGRDVVVVLAKRDDAFVLSVVHDGVAAVVDTFADEPTRDTRLAVDRDGVVFVATSALSRVELP